MEAASLLIAILNNLGPRLLSLVQKKYNLYKRFEGDVTYLRNKLPYITTATVQLLGQNSPLVEELSRLVHDIEDCIDHINYRALRKEHGISVSSRNMKSIEDIDKEMGRLKAEVQRLEPSIYDALAEMDRPVSNPSSCTPHSHLPFDRLVLPEELCGMQVPMEELREQLVEGEPKKLKVISIVGFCGLGKTLLAYELYESPDGKKFEERAWVSAAHGDSRELLREILRALDKQPPDTSDVFQLSIDLRDHLNNKKYFIVIDDMRRDLWNTIKSAFPSNHSSRVVLTTRFQSVATTCSGSTNGYIYKIGRLDKEHSKQLFMKKACPVKDLDYPQPDSTALLKKCDGQPLALTTVGEFMQKEGWPKGPVCQEACNLLRYRLDRDHTLKRLHELLNNDYSSLPTSDDKACLLYCAMFPSDHPIRTKRLMRRWLAEGLLKPSNSGSDLAVENLKMLMDQNIIEPIDVSNNMGVRTCKTYGMMHEYITLKSHSENTIALFGDGSHQPKSPKRVRRLSLRDNSIIDATNLEYNLVRSLIVTGDAENAMLDLSKYQLLRVLDLEHCTNLQNENLEELCNLLLLKYLSLGAGITNLPKKIKQLKLLETLDLRRSSVKILHPEVIKLPNLVNLFGKFKLQKKVVLASGQCKLQNFAGFIVDETNGFAELMSQMKKLRKVKIWCESSATRTNLTNLQDAIQNFIDDVSKSANDPRSLSVHFEGCSEDLLENLHGPCYLASLKLKGKFLKLPQFVNELSGLTELCLQSSTRFTADLLTALCDLKHLKYLKLIAEEIDEITIKDKKLRTLLCLCFVLERPKTFPKIEEGSMPYLESLQLLCKDLDGLSGIQIKGFTYLKEVILDNRVTNDTKSNWARVAKEHPNKPKVMLKRVDQQEGDCREDYCALGAMANEIMESHVLPQEPVHDVDTQISPDEPIQDVDIQMTLDEPNSAIYKTTGPPVVCAALSSLSISGNGPMSS